VVEAAGDQFARLVDGRVDAGRTMANSRSADSCARSPAESGMWNSVRFSLTGRPKSEDETTPCAPPAYG
jgi:hypothetical protein